MAIRKDIDPETPIIIYVLTDPTKNNVVRYVGWTSKNNINKRLKEHLKDARLGLKNHRANWIRSLLEKDFIPEIFEIDKGIYKNRQELERYWIKYYGREKLVNGTDGGDGSLGLIMSEESKKILSEKSKTQMAQPGTKENLSEKAKERWRAMSESLRKIISDKAKERWQSEDFRKNQLEKHIGTNIGENNPMFGKKHTEESKKKISELRKDRKISQETKDKTALAIIGLKRKHAKSKYMGLTLQKNNIWRVRIRYNRETLEVGKFENEIDAARAYDKKCYELYGDKAKLNFPEDYGL